MPGGFISSAFSGATGAIINQLQSGEHSPNDISLMQYARQKQLEKKYGIDDYDKAFLYNASIAQYQNDLALQNWNRENLYNSPREQMNRFLEAGLNPNLVYGAGASSGNAGNIGTPTVGGQVSPTDIQDSRTRKAAQRVNAWQAALSMLGSSLDVFQKLMTVRGTIKATNAQNDANAGQGLFNRDYWNILNDYAGSGVAHLKGEATVAQWMADRQNAELANRIALYKTFNNGGLTENDILNKPYYARLLDTQLENSQADLTWQNLMNDFKKLDYTLANDPDFGLKRFKQTEYDILRSKLKLQNADYRIKNRIYNWMPKLNIAKILDSFIPF